MNRPTRLAVAACSTVIALSGLVACGSNSDQPASSSESSKSSTEASPSPSPAASSSTGSSSSTQSATISIKDFAYKGPGTVEAGSAIMIKNEDSEAHTVTADDSKSGFDVKVLPGKTVMLTAPDAPGTYKFHCTFHANMHGTLTVG